MLRLSLSPLLQTHILTLGPFPVHKLITHTVAFIISSVTVSWIRRKNALRKALKKNHWCATITQNYEKKKRVLRLAQSHKKCSNWDLTQNVWIVPLIHFSRIPFPQTILFFILPVKKKFAWYHISTNFNCSKPKQCGCLICSQSIGLTFFFSTKQFGGGLFLLLS